MQAAAVEHSLLPEQTEQERIDAIVNAVREANAQLGGKLASETVFDSGRGVLVFNKSVVRAGSNQRDFYGVDSKNGPIIIKTDSQQDKMLGAEAMGQPAKFSYQEPAMDNVRLVTPIAGNADFMQHWQKAFETSRDAVLRDEAQRQALREARNQSLDAALSAVSKPIDLDNPPPPASAPAPPPAQPRS